MLGRNQTRTSIINEEHNPLPFSYPQDTQGNRGGFSEVCELMLRLLTLFREVFELQQYIIEDLAVVLIKIYPALLCIDYGCLRDSGGCVSSAVGPSCRRWRGNPRDLHSHVLGHMQAIGVMPGELGNALSLPPCT